MADVIDQLTEELGLPSSTADLLRSPTRNTPGRNRAKSHVSSVFSGGTENSEGIGDELVWRVVARWEGGQIQLQLNDNVMEKLGGMRGGVMMIEMDEEWIMEKRPDTQSSTPQSIQKPVVDLNSDSADGDDTLKASTSASSIEVSAREHVAQSANILSAFDTGTASSTRLSGLFHGWLDSNQHPAPPPSPQLSVVSEHAAVRAPVHTHDFGSPVAFPPVLGRKPHSRKPSVSSPLRHQSLNRSIASLQDVNGNHPALTNGTTDDQDGEWQEYLVRQLG